VSEFARPFALDALRERPVRHTVTAAAEERAALAKRFGVLAIDRLEAKLVLQRVRAGRAVRVEGRIAADLQQACVVSLQPVAQRVVEKFSVLFVPPEDLKPIPVDADGEIDVAAIAAEDELEESLPDGPQKARSSRLLTSRRNWPRKNSRYAAERRLEPDGGIVYLSA
jgi:uncharacterized metal-binding protein YceD (DUF177 family)